MKQVRSSRVLSVIAAVVVASPLVTGVAAAAPPGPVFTDGQAQPVFDAARAIREQAWVQAPVDSDRDGVDDLVHVQVVRPKATADGLRVPVVYQASPYFAGGNDVPNHDVDVELHVPDGKPRTEIDWEYERYLVSRGFAVVYAESLGSGQSTGCPTTGGENETVGARSVVDWLAGRAPARDADGAVVTAGWSTGHVGMMGVSYNGTLPNAVASTGVEGLETIVPIGAISDWYDYYREGGAVVAPGGYQGEDADVLAKYVYTRADREICRPVIDGLAAAQDRRTGDRNDFWDERDYLDDVGDIHASVLAVHGLNDWNVTTSQVSNWYKALAEHGVERKIWLHQQGHTDPIAVREKAWLRTLNRWFSHYLYGVDNGIEREPRATIQREDGSWRDERDWPAPDARDVSVYPKQGGERVGGLSVTPSPGLPVAERLSDDASKTVEDLVDAASSPHRLRYASPVLRDSVRLSGTATVRLRASFSRPAANVTGVLVDRAPNGGSHVITRGWTDPQNRRSPSHTDRLVPGVPYAVSFDLQPKDYVLAEGHRLEFVLLSSDHDFTLRPEPGAGVAAWLGRTSVTLPVVGGADRLEF